MMKYFKLVFKYNTTFYLNQLALTYINSDEVTDVIPWSRKYLLFPFFFVNFQKYLFLIFYDEPFDTLS